MRSAMVAGLCLTAAVSCLAQPLPAPASLQKGLQGHWTGVLQYKDYQSGSLVDLPVKQDIRVLPDDATVILVSAFDDGPKAGTVFVTTVALFQPGSDRVQSASFRRKNDSSISNLTVATVRYSDPSHWRLVFLEEGSDGGKPAQIRTTESRDGGALDSIEEYRVPGDTAAPWNFRNKTALKQD